MRSQNVTASKRNVRFLPWAFTEHGALMAANVLQSERAIAMSVELINAFIRLRKMAFSVEELARKIEALERGFRKQGEDFQVVFDALRQLLNPPADRLPRWRQVTHPIFFLLRRRARLSFKAAFDTQSANATRDAPKGSKKVFQPGPHLAKQFGTGCAQRAKASAMAEP